MRRDLYESHDQLRVKRPMFSPDRYSPLTEKQSVSREQRSYTAADGCCDGCTGYAEFGEDPQPKDKTRAENNVENVREPQHAHRDGCVACAAKDRVQQEQHHHDNVAAEHDAREGRALGDHRFVGAHEAEKVGRKKTMPITPITNEAAKPR